MRSNFPLSSIELNDKLLSVYERYVYLIGYNEYDTRLYSGMYDVLDNNISNLISTYYVINNEDAPSSSGTYTEILLNKKIYNYNICRGL